MHPTRSLASARSPRSFHLLLLFAFLALAATAPGQARLRGGDIVVSTLGPDLVKVDPVTGNQTHIATLSRSAGGIVVSNEGHIFATAGAEVIRVDPVTGLSTSVSSGDNFVAVSDIVIDANGDLIVTDGGALGVGSVGPSDGQVIRVDPDTGAQTVIASGLVDPRGLTLNANGDIILADFVHCAPNGFGNNVFNGQVIRVDPLSGAQTVISTGINLVDPPDVVIEQDGKILASNQYCGVAFGGQVVRVDPMSGAQSVVSNAGKFQTPRGIALEASGQILLADTDALMTGTPNCDFGGCGALFRVDPMTGVQTELASGGMLDDPIDVAVVPFSIATYEPFGAGCPGTAGTPTLDAAPNSRPQINGPFTVQLDNLPQNSPGAFVVFGFSTTDWAGFPLPADLTPFGIWGCTVYVSVDVAFPVAPVGSTAQLPFQIPLDPSLAFLKFYNQALVLDQGVNPLGGVVTNAAVGLIGVL